MHLFYTPDIHGQRYQLDDQESRHAIRVLRLVEGDHVVLVDGRGGWYEATIVLSNAKLCEVEVIQKTENYKPLPYSLHIGIAPTKHIDRFEWFMEKATEIGISEITPILCEHSERKHIRLDRMEKILISAIKQSQKAYKPHLNPMTPCLDWMAYKFTGTKAIGYCGMENEASLLWEIQPSNQLVVAIGPEGDFSASEAMAAIAHGFRPVSLGDSRLRTETAGVVVSACANQLFS